ncbi:hypothetical protein CR513_18125, partial [Mucuna pruriens]
MNIPTTPSKSMGTKLNLFHEGKREPSPKIVNHPIQLGPKPRVPFIIQVLARPVYNNNAIQWRYTTEEMQEPPIIKEIAVP